MPILTIADYDAIRKAISLDLDGAMLPDLTIGLPIYAGRAETWVVRRDPLALTRTAPDQVRIVKNAAIFYAAALIAPSMSSVTTMSDGGTSVTWKTDWKARANELLAMADNEIDALVATGEVDLEDRPAAFTVASSGRSWQPGPLPAGWRS